MQFKMSESIFRPSAFRHGVLPDIGQEVAVEERNENYSLQHFFSLVEGISLPKPPSKPGCKWRSYPTLPFYATVQGIQLLVNVAKSDEDTGDNMNDATLMKSLPMLQAVVQDAALNYCGVYYLGSLPASCNKLLFPVCAAAGRAASATDSSFNVIASTSAPELDYWRYLQALHDIFCRFVELRDLCCRVSSTEFCTHHVLFVRFADHPRLKDVVALLAIENARLCFCISASSKVTQQYFTQHAQDVGVELEWVLGSTMVSEPEKLELTDINPVFALWDVFVNLPLHISTCSLSSPLQSCSAGEFVYVDSSFDALVAERLLRNVDVTLLSSVRFAGSEWLAPTLRLCEVGQLADVGHHRFVWTLVGAPRVVLPHLVTGLVRCLVEKSSLDCFELRLTHEAVGRAGSTSGAGRGVAYVTAGAQRGALQRRAASSTSSSRFCAFSRLSAGSWLSDDDRQHYGLLLEDDPLPLECEFVVDSIRYCRRMEKAKVQPVDGVELFCPQRWGQCFCIKNRVEYILVDGEM